MRIGFLVNHPTQFEGPFFQYVARESEHLMHIIYTDSHRLNNNFDPELKMDISWGIDLLSGYSNECMPRCNRIHWLLNHLQRQKYDLLIINGYSRSEYIIAAILARLMGIPAALRLDSVQFGDISTTKRLVKRLLFLILERLYSHFFAIGSLTVEYLQGHGICEDHISLFSYVVDTNYFKEKSNVSDKSKEILKRRYHLPEQSTVVVSVTKFNEREAPWDLLKAFCEMPNENLYLLLVGDGNQRTALEQYVQAYPESHVIFTGYVPYPELPALYGIADVFVHPACYEPWGVSVQEALACGLPVITSSRVGAGYDLIEAGKNGFIYEAGNAADLKDKLMRLLQTFRREEVRNENERILSRWDYATTWRNILDVGQKYLSFQI
jgi:glycosyltransferase involved in cell wall biosynthesis